MAVRFSPLDQSDPAEIAGYQLRARLGSGGMGNVYLSFTRGGRPVALKVVRKEFADDPEFRRRFRMEVAAAQRVQGIYTAPVVDADPDAPVPWLATAYIAGPSLSHAVVEHGPLPEPSVYRLLAGVAEGLGAVHAAGLVHRDLKPANVLLAADGPRVIDFGIARAADATSLTGTGAVLGTPAFMTPEQVAGRPVSPATDVFALAHLVVYAATGHAVFGDGHYATLVYRIAQEEPDLSGCPDGLREFAGRCLAKDPSQRPDLGEIVLFAKDGLTGQADDAAGQRVLAAGPGGRHPRGLRHPSGATARTPIAPGHRGGRIERRHRARHGRGRRPANRRAAGCPARAAAPPGTAAAQGHRAGRPCRAPGGGRRRRLPWLQRQGRRQLAAAAGRGRH
ncbi:MAG TPA: serine/threonine-protein kinase [Trebonia sp.]|nr:serine/threonine-protein kinase [Trebonia sp.]